METGGYLHSPIDFPVGKGLLHILNKRPFGPHSWDRRFGEEKTCYRYREPNHSSSIWHSEDSTSRYILI